ncbi:MAG TPA: TIGR03986 family CRISPR-associated RAMP protein [Anaerolineae bacterium]
MIHDAGSEDDITLAILSSPKPTTTLFYLADGQGKPADVTYDTEGAQLRGRKVYRHHGAANQAEYTRATDEKHDGLDDQNRTIIGARKPDSAFEFTIDFENLAPVELGALVWALELEPGMCHRLGFAKPLGFGSVMLTVTALQLMDPGKHYAGLDGGWEDAKSKKGAWITKFKDMLESRHGPAFADLDNVRDLQTLLSKPRSKLPIHYPRTADKPDPEGKNFEWFVENKRGEPGRKDGMKSTLPLATEEEDKGGFPLHPSTPKPQR